MTIYFNLSRVFFGIAPATTSKQNKPSLLFNYHDLYTMLSLYAISISDSLYNSLLDIIIEVLLYLMLYV